MATPTSAVPSGSESWSLPEARRDGATRVLCAAALLHDRFARAVHRDLCIPKVESVPAAPGVDLVMLARHAAWALRRGLVREAGLAAAAGILGLWTLMGVTGSLSGGLFFQGGLLLLGAAWVWRTIADHDMARAAIESFRSDAIFGRGVELLDGRRARRLAAVSGSNLTIYSRQRGDPFPGLGLRLGDDVMPPVAIDRPADADTPIGPLSPAEMHEHLIHTIPAHGFDDIEVRNVLHVAGDWVQHIPALRPDPSGPPEVMAPPGLVYQVANEPRESLRTYLRAQLVRHGGALVTTLNVRVRMTGGVLSWDVVSHLLLPIEGAYSTVRLLPRASDKLLWHVLRHPRANLLKELLAAPGQAGRIALQLREQAVPARLSADDRDRTDGDPYGADRSVREYVSLDSRLDFHQDMDARDQLQRLSTAVFRGVVSYLRAQNVDVSELVKKEERAVGVIVANLGPRMQLNNYGQMHGTNLGQAGNVFGGPAGGPGGGPQAAPGMPAG